MTYEGRRAARRVAGALMAALAGLSAAGCGHAPASSADAAPGVTPPAATAPPPPQPLHQGAGAMRGAQQLKQQTAPK